MTEVRSMNEVSSAGTSQGGGAGQATGINQRAQITLGADEIDQMLSGIRSMTIASIGPGGQPHLVAMWFAVLDGDIWFETKAKSQKAVNLRRDPRISCLAEDGETYEDLRGVAIEGQAEVSDDPELLWRVGVAVWERYHGPYTDDVRSLVEEMLRKRVAVRVRPERIRPGFDRARSARSPVSLPGEGGGEREPPRSVRDESFGPRTDCRSDRAARYWLTVACCATTGTRAPARDERSGPQRRSGRYKNEWADEVGTDAARTTGRRWRPGQR
jgi:PPOX class probable F420-dependent enzyme